MEVFDDSVILNICIRRNAFDVIFFDLLTTNDILSGFFMRNIYPANSSEYIIFDIGSDNEMMETIFFMLAEQSRGDNYSGRIMDNLASIFFALLARKYGKNPASHRQMDKVTDRYREIISYINGNYKTVTLARLAGHFYISAAYCSRLIKSLAGKNFSALVRDIRNRHARSLLMSSTIKIYDISHSLGYENQETFIRNFKKDYGVSPGQYRQMYSGRS
jgi:YesN/AraC family two-component response regulator